MRKRKRVNKIKPIIFSTQMVRAIMDDKKTQTRRVIKPQPHSEDMLSQAGHDYCVSKAPYKKGDILWVRETWCWENSQYEKHTGYRYCSTCAWNENGKCTNNELPYWFEGKKPSLHMLREAARLFLRVTGVRAERLQEISGADAKAEGIQRSDREMLDGVLYEEKFVELWNSLYAKRGHGWETNPWVWVYQFERWDGQSE